MEQNLEMFGELMVFVVISLENIGARIEIAGIAFDTPPLRGMQVASSPSKAISQSEGLMWHGLLQEQD